MKYLVWSSVLISVLSTPTTTDQKEAETEERMTRGEPKRPFRPSDVPHIHGIPILEKSKIYRTEICIIVLNPI